MPYTISGRLGEWLEIDEKNKDLLAHNLAMLKDQNTCQVQNFYKLKGSLSQSQTSADGIFNPTTFRLITDLAIDGVPFNKWLATHHDDVEQIFNGIADTLQDYNWPGTFEISVAKVRENQGNSPSPRQS